MNCGSMNSSESDELESLGLPVSLLSSWMVALNNKLALYSHFHSMSSGGSVLDSALCPGYRKSNDDFFLKFIKKVMAKKNAFQF